MIKLKRAFKSALIVSATVATAAAMLNGLTDNPAGAWSFFWIASGMWVAVAISEELL